MNPDKAKRQSLGRYRRLYEYLDARLPADHPLRQGLWNRISQKKRKNPKWLDAMPHRKLPSRRKRLFWYLTERLPADHPLRKDLWNRIERKYGMIETKKLLDMYVEAVSCLWTAKHVLSNNKAWKDKMEKAAKESGIIVP